MSNLPIVRLTSIEIENLAGVAKGTLQLDKSELIKELSDVTDGNLSFDKLDDTDPEEVSILGLYGQNGSGKSTLVNALSLLRDAIARNKIKYNKYGGYESGHTVLKCDFVIWEQENKEEYKVTYQLDLINELNEAQLDMSLDPESRILKMESKTISKGENHCYVKSEILSYSYFSPDEQQRKVIAISTAVEEEPFGPGTRLKSMTKNKQIAGELIEHKKTCYKRLKSFIFCKKVAHLAEGLEDPKIAYILKTLYEFAANRWIIISAAHLTEKKSLRLRFPYPLTNPSDCTTIEIPIRKPVLLSASALLKIQEIIAPLKKILPMLVPGHSIDIILNPSNVAPPYECMLVSVLNDDRRIIPFRNESGGVKRTVSILLALLSMYHQTSVTVVIDEMDATIFEYLLGQILDVLAVDGKGQLIFTSHNLHLLEVLDKKFLAFTTPDTTDRYTRIPNIKRSNNLRDVYYRYVQGGQLYENISTEEISDAFQEASLIKAPKLLDEVPELKELAQRLQKESQEAYDALDEMLGRDPDRIMLLSTFLKSPNIDISELSDKIIMISKYAKQISNIPGGLAAVMAVTLSSMLSPIANLFGNDTTSSFLSLMSRIFDNHPDPIREQNEDE